MLNKIAQIYLNFMFKHSPTTVMGAILGFLKKIAEETNAGQIHTVAYDKDGNPRSVLLYSVDEEVIPEIERFYESLEKEV